MIKEKRIDVSKLPRPESMDTLFDMLLTSVIDGPDDIAFIYNAKGEEQQVSYAKLLEDVLLLSIAFKKRGVKDGDKVMLLSDNRYSWIVTDFALIALGAVSVPRGSDTPTSELEFIIEHSDSNFLVIETSKLLDYHEHYLKKCRQLKSIFIMMAPEVHTIFNRTYSYRDILGSHEYTEKDVKTFLEKGLSVKPSDLLTIIYTSGTTGRPKGVQLSHDNIMHNVGCVPNVIHLTREDKWLSILPSWHIFERTAEYVALVRNSCIVYSSVRTLAPDLETYKPTLLATVPRVWESLYSKVDAGVRKKGKNAYRLFQGLLWISAAYKRNKRRFLNRLPVMHKPNFIMSVWQKISSLLKMIILYPFFKLAEKKLSAVKLRFGGNLRLAISGGGSLAEYLEEWLDAVGIRIVNAYGMTECSPAISGRGVDCRVPFSAGPPVVNTSVRIVDEVGNEVPQGEEGLVEVLGQQVTAGYYKDDEENAKSFCADGYFKTGDLGKITISGEVVITGRYKDIIVLSSGENIDPTRIESAISNFPFIKDAVLVGQDKKGLGALLVADSDELLKYANSKIANFKKSGEEMLKDNKILDHIRRDMNAKLRPKQGFKSYEKIHNITFLDKELTLGEELTNTFKKKRHVIETKYKEIINRLFN
ncbi:MAG: long-chain fatty acid--CoA ligase [Desulfotalea sp.]